MSKRCLVIPDLQVKPGVRLDHLTWASHYIADKQPDIVVQNGDWGDWPSLSSWDRGKAAAENRRVSKDWDSVRLSIDLLEKEFIKVKGYKPRKVFTKGNHDNRVDWYKNDNPQVDTLPDLCVYLQERGWETHDFLHVATIDGVLFSHLFPRALTGRVTNSGIKYGAPSANNMVRANMASCVAGHKPGLDTSYVPGPQGKMLCGLIAGSYYLHDETYNGPGSDCQWRGLVMLNRFGRGEFDACPVNVKYLKEKYGR